MFSFGYRDRKWRMIKDSIFVVIAFMLIWRAGFFGVLLGCIALVWYGRDLYYQIRAAKLEKEAAREQEKAEARRQDRPQQQSAQSPDDGRITITDLSDAKEVNYEKE